MVARRRAPKRAFTLVELAVVVTIVGVLAVLAVAGYRKITLSAKVSEAQNVINAIRLAQEDYKTERGAYADMGSGWCPDASGQGLLQRKTQWSPDCDGGNLSWRVLPVHVDGPVQFGYRTKAGTSGFADPFSIGWVSWGGAPTNRAWYVIQAQADLNGDGTSGLNTELVGTSFQNTVFSRNVGE